MKQTTLLISIISLFLGCAISAQICHGNYDQVSVLNSENGFKVDIQEAPYENFLLQLEFEDYISYQNFYYLTLNKVIPGGNQVIIEFKYHDGKINYYYPFYTVQGYTNIEFIPKKINENYRFKTISLYVNRRIDYLYYGYLFQKDNYGPYDLDTISGTLYVNEGSSTKLKAMKIYKDITDSQRECLIQTEPAQFQTCQKGYLYVNGECVNSQICNQNPQSYARVYMTGKSVYNPLLRTFNITFEANNVQNPKCVEGYIQDAGRDKNIIQYSGSILNPTFTINENQIDSQQFYYILYNRNTVALQFTVQVNFTIPTPPNSQQSKSIRFKYEEKNSKNKLYDEEDEEIIDDSQQQQQALRYLLENQNSQGQPLQLYKKYSIQTTSPFDYHTNIVLYKNYKFKKPLDNGSYRPYSDIFAQLQVKEDYLLDGSQLVFQNTQINQKKAEIVSMDMTDQGWLNLTIRPIGQVDIGYSELTIHYKFIYNY